VSDADYLRERTRRVIEGVEARGFIRFEYALISWVRAVGGLPVRLPTMIVRAKPYSQDENIIEPIIEWWCDEKSVKAALALRALGIGDEVLHTKGKK